MLALNVRLAMFQLTLSRFCSSWNTGSMTDIPHIEYASRSGVGTVGPVNLRILDAWTLNDCPPVA